MKIASLGAHIVIHHHRPHDLDQPWGGDDLDQVRSGVRRHLAEDARFADIAANLSDSARIPELIHTAAGLKRSRA